MVGADMLTGSRPHTVLTFVFMEQLRRLTQWSFADQKGLIKV